MKTIAIIQARMGATRLPDKPLMPLGVSCMLDYVVTRCHAINAISDVIVATSNAERDDRIEQWCMEQGVLVSRGSEEDVLSRFVDAAAPYEPYGIVRVTGDNPFFDYALASELVSAASVGDVDLLAFDAGHPVGSAVEFITWEALQRLDALSGEKRHREHVTYYAYEYPETLRIRRIAQPESVRQPQLRITVDTEADYAVVRAIAKAFPGHRTVPTDQVVQFLLQHDEITAMNSHIEQKPVR